MLPRLYAPFPQVYEHWVAKRAKRCTSLLRCYHNFIMDLWQRQVPPRPT